MKIGFSKELFKRPTFVIIINKENLIYPGQRFLFLQRKITFWVILYGEILPDRYTSRSPLGIIMMEDFPSRKIPDIPATKLLGKIFFRVWTYQDLIHKIAFTIETLECPDGVNYLKQFLMEKIKKTPSSHSRYFLAICPFIKIPRIFPITTNRRPH